MTRRGRRYLVLVGLMALPLAWGGFSVGSAVRQVLDEVAPLAPATWLVVRVESPTTLYVRDGAVVPDQPPCELVDRGGSARLAAAASGETVDVGSQRWRPVATVEPVVPGTVGLRCRATGDRVDWALGPTAESARHRIGGAAARASWWAVATAVVGGVAAVALWRAPQR
ncbi:MAG: hypothetical protein OEV62_08065 [Actinomycetota bacterium]|nr:hypothetical protein [Actinomycetota bacterium]